MFIFKQNIHSLKKLAFSATSLQVELKGGGPLPFGKRPSFLSVKSVKFKKNFFLEHILIFFEKGKDLRP